MTLRIVGGLFLLATLALPGCQFFKPREVPLETPEIIMPQFHRPGSSGKVYSLNPRMQSVERSLGLR